MQGDAPFGGALAGLCLFIALPHLPARRPKLSLGVLRGTYCLAGFAAHARSRTSPPVLHVGSSLFQLTVFQSLLYL